MSPGELWGRLSARDRRAVRLGVLALAPGLLWVYAVSPFLGAVEERRSRLEARTTQLEAERDLLAARDRYPERVRHAAARLQRAAPALLDSRSRGVATAELTQFVEDRAAAARLRLVATEPGAARRADRRLLAVPMTVEGESDLQGVLAFLDALENGPKLLRVEDLRIRRNSGASRLRDRGMEVLVVRATVTGYMLVPEGTASAAAVGELPPAPDSAASDAREAIRTAVTADPFRQQRRPPERRYVLPGNRSDDRASRRPARRGGLRLVGTATFADREGVAAFRLEDGRPRVAGLGAEVGGMRIMSVEQGRVVVSGPDTTLVLRVDPDEERP